MDNPALGQAQLSPLDQIRIAEADVTRKVAAAREEREHVLAHAKPRANELRREAEESGRREGQNQYREIVARAEEEAKAILAGANHRAKELRRKGSRHMDTAVSRVVHIVTGIEERGGDS